MRLQQFLLNMKQAQSDTYHVIMHVCSNHARCKRKLKHQTEPIQNTFGGNIS